ncbi:MAG: hypothetical protein PHU08_03380 [Dehalococcoidales bacterium]|nr:hypothetical protein [Dehalococcoidales bacterium]
MKARIKQILNRQKGITGLETAIILIAFVMVASVFAYVVLSAGLFSSQKAKDAINTGLSEVQSTMELKGDVLAKMDSGIVTDVIFTLGGRHGADSVDLTDTSEGNNKVIISYNDAYQQYPTLDWTMTKLSDINGDNLLDANELFQIDVNVQAVSDNATSDDAKLTAYHTFTLEMKPPIGPILSIERTVPSRVDAVVNLK